MAISTSNANPGTQRTDNWQLAPLLTFLGFAAFIVYTTWRAFMNSDFTGQPEDQYLSPMFSPYIPEVLHFLGIRVPSWEFSNPSAPMGLGWLVSPAIFVLWAPAAFRGTCYYYRKAYYRSFFSSPAACAVGQPNSNPLFNLEHTILGRLLKSGKGYTGEARFPMVFQNLHRYFFYVAALFIFILSWDAIAGSFLVTRGADGALHGWSGLRIGIGTLLMYANAILLGLYTFGCHSWRHIVGGHVDCFSACSAGSLKHDTWKRQSILNEHHMLFAWLSLFTVGFTDFYIFMVSKGIWVDPVLFSTTWLKGV